MYQRQISDLSFKTKKEAAEFMHSNSRLKYHKGIESVFEQTWSFSGQYTCSQGEYARPDFVLRRYKDGWGIKIIYYYFHSTLFPPKDRRAVQLDFDVMV